MPGQWRANAASQTPGPAVTDAAPMVRPAERAPHDPTRPSFPFFKLCLVMEAIRDAQGHEKKREKLVKFFDNYRARIGLDLVRFLSPPATRLDRQPPGWDPLTLVLTTDLSPHSTRSFV